MRLLSVNVSLPKEVPHGSRTVETGIFKEPVEGRVILRELNLDGDGQADLVNHGGPHRAAYAYPMGEHSDVREVRPDGASGGLMPETSLTGVLVVAAVAFVIPFVLGLAPAPGLPAVVLEIVASVAIGPSGFGLVEVNLPLQVLALLGLAFLLF